MQYRYEDIALEAEGQVVNAKMRHRQRRQKGKARDLERKALRREKREREWA